jgi:ribulose-phosphate 3-epimerase
MVKIAPSLLSANFLKLADELKATEEAGVDMLHIDVMDGHFVPNMTIGPFIVEFIRGATKLPLDVHLMIEEPERYVRDFIKAGADYVTVHIEASRHLHRTVGLIKEYGAKAGVSLNPSTPVMSIESIIHDIDLALLMSVNPGFGGQEFIPHVIDKIRAMKSLVEEKKLPVLVEVDGGIKPENARAVADAGADILVMGSAFYKSGDYRKLVEDLRRRFSA